MRFYRLSLVFLAMVIVLAACNLPSASPTAQYSPNAVFTAAAQTVEAQLTQNALLNPASVQPTFPPAVGTPAAPVTAPALASTGMPTPAQAVQSTTACDAAQFEEDVTIPDGTVLTASATFTKTWRLKNVGTCVWNTSYALVFDSGDQMGGATSQPLSGKTGPGFSLDVTVNLQAPAKDGGYRGFWGVVNATGVRMPVTGGTNGNSFYVDIKVGSGTADAATSLPGTEGTQKFAVLSVGLSALRNEVCSSPTGKYVITATITTNQAGNVNYTWVRSDGFSSPGLSDTLSFNAAGSKSITYEWVSTISGLWVDLYIDKPNHQQFGRVNLSCP